MSIWSRTGSAWSCRTTSCTALWQTFTAADAERRDGYVLRPFVHRAEICRRHSHRRFEDVILTENGKELKGWDAIARYMASFEDTDGDGIGNVPDYYSTLHDRKR